MFLHAERTFHILPSNTKSTLMHLFLLHIVTASITLGLTFLFTHFVFQFVHIFNNHHRYIVPLLQKTITNSPDSGDDDMHTALSLS